MATPRFRIDEFARNGLPSKASWPDFLMDLPELAYPEFLNCAGVLLHGVAREPHCNQPAIMTHDEVWTYSDLAETVARMAQVLRDDFDLAPGHRVVLRAANTPACLAAWLAIVAAGGIAVTTMPLLRSGELSKILVKSRANLILCEHGLDGELAACGATLPDLRIVRFGRPDAELEMLMRGKSAAFTPHRTRQDDVCLIAFTSGTTGEPKAALHFHRDVLSICHTYAAHVLPRCDNAVFSGTPPIAFTFGLGALLIFPLFFGAAVALPRQSTPPALLEIISLRRVTHVFTSPTGYRAMLDARTGADLSSLKACVAAGEHLPAATWEAWRDATGLRLLDGVGATEMLHIFISSRAGEMRPGSAGKPVPGFEAALLDSQGRAIVGAGEGRLAVRGPTGCRYLNDPRQSDYVIEGWNLPGDIFRRDEDGFYWYVSRSDDMIVSSGYNIAGPEVEAALLGHPSVRECAVVGEPDPARGSIVKAYIVLKDAAEATPQVAAALQEYVKTSIAPYKYPRAITFVEELPRTATGKVARRLLRPET